MSTKRSLAWGEKFHLYDEMFDDESVHLRLDSANFEVYPDSVCVEIPRAIWEVIRAVGATDLSAAHWTDEELTLFVKGQIANQDRRVSDHLAKCEPCRTGGECAAGFMFKGAWLSTEEGLTAMWREARTKQRAIADQVAVYKQAMKGEK